MHVVANGASPSDTALGRFRTLSVTKKICAHMKSCNLNIYDVIEFATVLFLFAGILATHFKNSSVHAMPRETCMARLCFFSNS